MDFVDLPEEEPKAQPVSDIPHSIRNLLQKGPDRLRARIQSQSQKMANLQTLVAVTQDQMAVGIDSEHPTTFPPSSFADRHHVLPRSIHRNTVPVNLLASRWHRIKVPVDAEQYQDKVARDENRSRQRHAFTNAASSETSTMHENTDSQGSKEYAAHDKPKRLSETRKSNAVHNVRRPRTIQSWTSTRGDGIGERKRGGIFQETLSSRLHKQKEERKPSKTSTTRPVWRPTSAQTDEIAHERSRPNNSSSSSSTSTSRSRSSSIPSYQRPLQRPVPAFSPPKVRKRTWKVADSDEIKNSERERDKHIQREQRELFLQERAERDKKKGKETDFFSAPEVSVSTHRSPGKKEKKEEDRSEPRAELDGDPDAISDELVDAKVRSPFVSPKKKTVRSPHTPAPGNSKNKTPRTIGSKMKNPKRSPAKQATTSKVRLRDSDEMIPSNMKRYVEELIEAEVFLCDQSSTTGKGY